MILNCLIWGISIKMLCRKEHINFHIIKIIEFEEQNTQVLIMHFNFIFMSTVGAFILQQHLFEKDKGSCL